MKQLFLLILMVLSLHVEIFSQGEIDDEKKVFFRDEKSWAFFVRNNGVGFNFRKAKHINARKKYIWTIDMHNIRRAKETKTYTYSTQSGGFVFGKMNFAWDTRFGVGYQHLLYEKFDKNGVAIRVFYNGGPAVLMLKPVYYEVSDGVTVVDKKFTMVPSYPYIIDRSSFLKGIEETKFNPGAFVRGGISFEYSKLDRRIAALELGMILSAYLNEFEILWKDKTRYVFSLFVSFRWGKIIRGGRMKNVELEDEILN